VRLRFLDDATCGASFLQPLIQLGAEACAPCQQYFNTLVNYPSLTEVCTVFGNNVYLSVDADCCVPTPTLPDSWGRMKQIHR